MQEPTLIHELNVHNELGEGIVWDATRQVVWWTDIQRAQLFCYATASGELTNWETPERLACCAPVAGRDELVVAFASGFAFFDPASGRVKRLHDVEPELPHTRLNDGRCDRQGRFWSGSMVEGDNQSGPRGALYRLGRNGDCTSTLLGLTISNGLCWSPEGDIMYHTDTPSGHIDRYAFDSESGIPVRRKTFVRSPPGCSPDGATVDADGYVWSAQWGGSRVIRYAPSGAIDLELKVPASQPTCVAFGGPELDQLYVTSARQGLDEETLALQPSAGNVFVFATDVRGLEETPFQPD